MRVRQVIGLFSLLGLLGLGVGCQEEAPLLVGEPDGKSERKADNLSPSLVALPQCPAGEVPIGRVRGNTSLNIRDDAGAKIATLAGDTRLIAPYGVAGWNGGGRVWNAAPELRAWLKVRPCPGLQPGWIAANAQWVELTGCARPDQFRCDEPPPPPPPPTGGAFSNLVSWAYTPYPHHDQAKMYSDMVRMRDAGANAVYISHSNPGNVTVVNEVGLTFSVWYNLVTDGPRKNDAQQVKDAVERAVRAASDAGLKILLAVGYQIQLGDEWNAAHPNDLRREANGAPMNHWGSGLTASPYSPAFKQDIQRYYRWVDETFVRRYPAIVALNLADEPMGSDFSAHAQLPADPVARGKRLSEVLADYAALTAGYWMSINPQLKVMMTFHVQRTEPWFPGFEAIFAKTPANFVFSADTHYHDGLPDSPTPDVAHLYSMVRTLGWYSRVYGKPLMLWTAANNWGLTPYHGTDWAGPNLEIVYQESRRFGGSLAMIMAWGYNINHQGLFDVPCSLAFGADDMFNFVSSKLAAMKGDLSTPGGELPGVALMLDAQRLYGHVSQHNVGHLAGQLVNLLSIPEFAADRRSIVILSGGQAEAEVRARGIPIKPIY